LKKKINAFDRLRGSLIQQLSKGKEVLFKNTFLIKKKGDSIVLRYKVEGQEVELFFKAEKGDTFGLSKEQLRRIVALQEKPAFKTFINSK
jgi:hypothetical protein